MQTDLANIKNSKGWLFSQIIVLKRKDNVLTDVTAIIQQYYN